jgi:isopentenyl-diphosphate delta-isomerase
MAVDMIEADTLALHLNTLQEIIQPEGNVNFADLLKKIKNISESLSVPVMVKEVGCGMPGTAADKLLSAGVRAIDVGGYGGTSWNRIEGFRAEPKKREISEIFDRWGIPTAYSLLDVKERDCPKIASGGIRDGIEAAKAIALGADLIGIALPVLKMLDDNGEEGVHNYMHQLADELRIAMFLTGCGDIKSLKETDYKLFGKAREWINQS